MKITRIASIIVGIVATNSLFAQGAGDSTPAEQQLPRKMHEPMKVLPRVTVGRTNADIIGADNRALQAAVEYVAGLGGGVVEIGPGEYLMRDSLHLRSFVTVRGTPGQTVLRKADGVVSALTLDGDYGEEQITVAEPKGFEVGCGVAVWSATDNYFHLTTARITGSNGKTFSLDHPLNADYQVGKDARAATVYPVVSGCNVEGVRIEHLIIEGNREHNVLLDGCRGGGIYLYRGFGTVIEHCTVRNFNGDGISFQQSNDVIVNDCVSEGNAALGLHPGSGSQRPIIRNCVARNNGADGLFLCWRVRFGTFEDNLLENNGRYGISIGHKDTDNLLRANRVRGNFNDGVYFRDETGGMAGHRNRLEDNLIENNGVSQDVAGIRVRGETFGTILKNNTIRDTRPAEAKRQNVGIQFDPKAGAATLENNRVEATMPIKDQRSAK